jgi:Lon protease-like protein
VDTLSIPLFPLHSVLFPSGALPLRIFEPRYLEMISSCMKTSKGFGICLIRKGSEVGEVADTYNTGTLSEITYFNTQPDGLLGITASGKQRFEIVSREVQSNKLTVAQVRLLPNEPNLPLPDEFQPAVQILKHLFQQLGYPFIKIEKHYTDASWVGYRLAELLPLGLKEKQIFLQMNDPIQRIEEVWELMEKLDLR